GEWRSPAKHVISDRAERIDVCARVECDPLSHLFRRHVFRSADDPSRGRTTDSFGKIGMNNLRQAEVANLHKSIISNATPASPVHDEDVGGLKIAMKDILIVGRFDARDDLAHERCCSLCIKGSFTSQEVIESLAFDVLHYEKENAVRTLTKVCDVYDVWMLY